MSIKCLSVHLTDLCNSKCTFCVVGSPLYTKDSIVYDRVVQFLHENAGNGYEAVNLHGGEATIHPRFLDTLALIRDLGYPEVHLQTNAIALSKPEFAQRVVDLGVTLFIISLHGHTPDVQDSQTGTPGGLERTLAGIRNVKQRGARVRTNTVITRQNVASLPSIAQLAVDQGVDHINFSNLHPVGSATFALERITPTFAEVREFLYPAIDIAVEAGRRVSLEGFPYCTVSEKVDFHLNNEYRDIRMLMRGVVIEDYDAFMSHVCRVFGPPCASCPVRESCGGVYPEYVELRGWDEFSAIPAADAPQPVSVAR
jgi:MoaA/NifB/PqqE/SkfB family radical SAM enzyme